MNIFKVYSPLNALLCLIGFLKIIFVFYIMNIHIYNLFYMCTLMDFVPENKLIRIYDSWTLDTQFYPSFKCHLTQSTMAGLLVIRLDQRRFDVMTRVPV